MFRMNDLSPAVKELLAGKTAQDGKPAIYLCEHGTCQAPIAQTEALKAALDQI